MPTIQKNTKIANRYGLNIRICDSNDSSKVYQTIDFANISSLDLSGDTVYARGGARQEKRIGFYDKLVGEFTLSTQILTNDLLCLMTGSTGNWDGESPITFKNRLLEKVRTFTLFGDTVWKDEDGNVYSEEIVLHKVRPRIAYNRSYDGSGDVASVDIVFDLMEDENGLVFSTGKGSELNVVAGTLISTYGAVDANSVWDLGAEGVVEDNVLYLGEEPEDIDPLVGTWVFNESVFAPDSEFLGIWSDTPITNSIGKIISLADEEESAVEFTCDYLSVISPSEGKYIGVELRRGSMGISIIRYGANADVSAVSSKNTFKSIEIYDAINLVQYSDTLLTWLQTNATKQ